MAGVRGKWRLLRPLMSISWSFLLAAVFVSAERSFKKEAIGGSNVTDYSDADYLSAFAKFLWQPSESGYEHVWPEMKFDWKIVLGSIIGFLGAAFGSVGGVGGGGIFVPMLTLIIGFDAKSATAISKCMIMGAAVSTVYYNLKLRHPTLDMPIIDYDLAVLIQPMLMLGISIGVTFNVIFADWMVTVLLIVLFIGTSTKAFLRGVETWKKETIMKKEAARQLAANGELAIFLFRQHLKRSCFLFVCFYFYIYFYYFLNKFIIKIKAVSFFIIHLHVTIFQEVVDKESTSFFLVALAMALKTQPRSLLKNR
nr:sulfite exporter TauE/SafE family protein 3-like [Ipomoea batatas]